MAGLLPECRSYPDRNKTLCFSFARREFFVCLFVLLLMQLFPVNLIIRSRRASRTWLVFWRPLICLSQSLPSSFCTPCRLHSRLFNCPYLPCVPSSQSTHSPAKKKRSKEALMRPVDEQTQIQWSGNLQLGSCGHLANVPVQCALLATSELSLSRSVSQWGASTGQRCIVPPPPREPRWLCHRLGPLGRCHCAVRVLLLSSGLAGCLR